MIGFIGHADLSESTLSLVQSEVRRKLRRMDPRLAVGGLARAGAGLPVTFARAVREVGLKLVTVLPAADNLPLPLPRRDAVAAGEMVMLADQVRLVDFDPRDRDARITVDERLIRGCRRVLAVWDGSASTPRDVTAHLVAYARGLRIPVDVIWPPGAARV